MTFSALLLAGGESRRMGRDKATMEFQGRPLWKRQLQTLRELDPHRILVSTRTRPSWLPEDTDLILDDSPSRGPLSGIAKALAVLETSHVIVLAVDMPFMTATELGKLLELTTEDCGVVPIIGERAEPLAAIYPANAAADFEAALAGFDYSLQLIVRKLAAAGKVTLRPVPDVRANRYRSVNEPGDVKL